MTRLKAGILALAIGASGLAHAGWSCYDCTLYADGSMKCAKCVEK